MYYVAVDIGCIECGEASAVLGIFTNKEAAESVVSEHAKRQEIRWSGEHRYIVTEIPEINVINKVEY